MSSLIPADEALAILRAAGMNAQKSPARLRGRCQTLCYLVAGEYVNLGRLRQLAREALAAQAEPAPVVAEPEVAPAPAPVKGCRLAGGACHLFALFARRYSLTPA